MALNSYQQTQSRGYAANPTQAEYHLFSQVTSALVSARDSGRKDNTLYDALDWNRRMWSVLSTDCGVEGNGLPDSLRAGIVSLSIWVGKYTSQVIRSGADINALIDINKTIMEGLAAQIENQNAAAAASSAPPPKSFSGEA